MDGWQKVYENEIEHKAEIVKSILDEHSMHPVLISKKDSAYNNFGKYEVFVSADLVIRALKIINDQTNL
jgi:hypothetical protein